MTAAILAILACALWLYLILVDVEKIDKVSMGKVVTHSGGPVHVDRMTFTDKFGNKITLVNCTFYPQKGQP